MKVLDGVIVKSATELEHLKLPFNFPVIVKPNGGGSSIGVAVAKEEKDLYLAVNYALRYGDSAIIEPMLKEFIEINCAGYKNKKGEIIVSLLEKPIGKGEVLSFDDKYNGGEREFPARVEENLAKRVQDLTKLIYASLNFLGTVRIDFFLKDGEIIVNEINSVPGSLAYYLFCDTLEEFSTLLEEMIAVGEQTYAKNSAILKKFKTNILSGVGAKGTKPKR